MINSKNFGDIIAVLAATDKKGVVDFLRGQGVNINTSDDVTKVVKVLYIALTSEKFRKNFIQWAELRFQNQVNAAGIEKRSNSKFEPMSVQISGQDFDPISSQMGSNLLDDNFANASGEFNPMDSQSGGFAPMETQFVNVEGATNTGGNTGKTGFLANTDWSGLINGGINIWQTSQASKQQKELIESQLKAKEIELQILVEQGKISSQQMKQQLDVLKQQGDNPKNYTVLYIVGGVVLLGALGTAIYFITRKK